MTDDDILNLVSDEMRRAIGFDGDDNLSTERTIALQYALGEVPDMPAPPGRSKAVSTDVRDAVETAMPDLIEVLTNEAVVEFPPTGEDDEEQAEIETEFVRNVFFEENAGFMALYSAIKDALTLRLGVLKVWAEREESQETGQITGAPEGSASMAEQGGLAVSDYVLENGQESFTVTRTVGKGRVYVTAWPVEDFAYSRDATSIETAVYVAARSRVRAFQLIARGYDPEKVRMLSAYGALDDELEQARDVAGDGSLNDVGGVGDHRLVETVEHFIRSLDYDGNLVIERVVTDSQGTILFERETVQAIPFAVGTPYMMPHRIMGQSVSDLLMEVQRIKTSLLRMALDSGYFALNQRAEIAEDAMTPDTIGDYLNNAPMSFIRSRNGNAVKPLASGGLSFDVWGAMQAVSEMGENRSGIIRAAQGLNSDALHDTASGMGVLQAAAQKRVRLIARVLAETMIGPAFKLAHAACREAIQEPVTRKLSATWRDNVIPAQWREREDITVDVGVGTGGRAEDIAYSGRILETIERLAQGGFGGVLVTPQTVRAAVLRSFRAMGVRNVDSLIADPSKSPPQPEGEQPDPAVAEAQAKLAARQQEAAMDAQIAREKMQVEMQMAREKMQFEAQLAREKMQLEAELGLIRDANAPSLPSYRPGGSLTS